MLEVKTELNISGFNLRANFVVGNELVVIFGPSGSGKSLTLNLIAGLIKPDNGLIRVGDKVFFSSESKIALPPQRREVGYVFQDYSLFPHLTVARNIAFGLPKLGREECNSRVNDMLALMRLDHLGDHYPHQISGGQKQRVALARALIFQPSLLLLDEPLSALDSAVREKLRLDLLKIKESYDIPIVFVTHDLEEAYMLADKIVVFDKGEVLQVGTRDEVFFSPANRTVARFVGAKNIYSGRIIASGRSDCRIATDRFEAVAPVGGLPPNSQVEFCVRPEDIMIVRPDRDLSQVMRENIFSGHVVSAMRRGPTYQLAFKLNGSLGAKEGFDFTIRIPSHAFERLKLAIGCPINISLKKSAIHVLGSQARPPISAGPKVTQGGKEHAHT